MDLRELLAVLKWNLYLAPGHSEEVQERWVRHHLPPDMFRKGQYEYHVDGLAICAHQGNPLS